MGDLVVVRADLGGDGAVDIRIADGRIHSVGPDLPVGDDDRLLDAAGGAVLPGLHDHHVHLYAAAAAGESLPLGPDHVESTDRFAEVLRRRDRELPAGAWIRGVGYHERVAGELDRHQLDRIVAHRPVRIQHRTGSQWILNTHALEAVLAGSPDQGGIEADRAGSPTGRLFRMDEWIEAAAGRLEPGLDVVGERAARFGITGLTDATPFGDIDRLDTLARARTDGRLPQRVTVMTAPDTGPGCPPTLGLGPVKIMLDDQSLPPFDQLVSQIRAAHGAGRPVALHCVTRVQLVLTIAVLEEAGGGRGDRIEHGAVIPSETIPVLGRLGVTVVTNPGFVHDRGDDYLTDVDPEDREDLYRCRSLLAAGVAVAAGTDAPFGPDDPWTLARTAVVRRSRSGRAVGAGEGVDPTMALSLLLGSAERPDSPRVLAPGRPGDLCVLAVPFAEGLRTLDAANVAVTVIGGEVAADNR